MMIDTRAVIPAQPIPESTRPRTTTPKDGAMPLRDVAISPSLQKDKVEAYTIPLSPKYCQQNFLRILCDDELLTILL